MKKKRIIVVVVIAVILVVVISSKACNKKPVTVNAETAKAQFGNVNTLVTATGTIEAIKTVEVGTRVSGEIRKIYVDYNSEVKAGDLLAELDRKPLTTALTIAEASLENAKSEMTYQTSNYNRIKALFEKKLVAESDYDQALYNYKKATTSLKTSQLNYDKAKIDLEYAYIYSPIEGVVLSRAVDEGQTVAASFSTPTLFTIANDLTRMQVEASIDEADIGQVKNDQRVEFTVDAYPNDVFTGKITQIRLEPVITSNVVTYTVIVQAENPEKKLMPGMTASINIFVKEANNVLVIPSKALRLTPDIMTLNMYRMQRFGGEKNDTMKPRDFKKPEGTGFGPGGGEWNQNDTKKEANMVWVITENDIKPVPVQPGLNNDIEVEIKSGLKEGDEVLTSLSSGFFGMPGMDSQTRSPFMPGPPQRRTGN